jgi:hypothetical protein
MSTAGGAVSGSAQCHAAFSSMMPCVSAAVEITPGSCPAGIRGSRCRPAASPCGRIRGRCVPSAASRQSRRARQTGRTRRKWRARPPLSMKRARSAARAPRRRSRPRSPAHRSRAPIRAALPAGRRTARRRWDRSGRETAVWLLRPVRPAARSIGPVRRPGRGQTPGRHHPGRGAGTGAQRSGSLIGIADRMSVGIDNFMSVPNHCPEPMMGRLSIG